VALEWATALFPAMYFPINMHVHKQRVSRRHMHATAGLSGVGTITMRCVLPACTTPLSEARYLSRHEQRARNLIEVWSLSLPSVVRVPCTLSHARPMQRLSSCKCKLSVSDVNT
jgi:hypothetical protein